MAIITEIYKARWQVLTEIGPFQNLNWGLISSQKTSLGIMVWMMRQNLSTIFIYLYGFQLKPMVLFDWKVTVNLHCK